MDICEHCSRSINVVPMVKSKFGGNNHSVASNSVIVKLLDSVVMILYGKSLQLDELQFSNQHISSTTIGTRIETIAYFLRNCLHT